ncbi:hypothetical protein, partial [Enterococcus faecalis]|uniref:hypothetical protein n=1 Tax=Enterococcus faecalis TaxID=1351 RepID=UPI00398527F2
KTVNGKEDSRCCRSDFSVFTKSGISGHFVFLLYFSKNQFILCSQTHIKIYVHLNRVNEVMLQ